MFDSPIVRFLGPFTTATIAFVCIITFCLVLLEYFDHVKPKPKTKTKTQDEVARWHETTRELAKARSELAGTKATYIQAEYECADAVSALDMIKEKLKERDVEIEALKNKVAAAMEAAAATAATTQTKNLAHDRTTCPDFKFLITQNHRLTSTINDQACTIDTLNRTRDILSRSGEAWRANNAATIHSMQATIDEVRGELAEMNAENERLTSDVKELISTVEELTAEQQVWEEDLVVVVRKDGF